MQKDYKMFPPSVNWDNIIWSTRKPQMDFSVQCAICSAEDVDVINHRNITVAGYAVSGVGHGIERVDISVDGGKTWMEAQRYQKSNVPYVVDSEQNSEKWALVLFKAVVDAPDNAEIIAKAVNTAANIHPENVEVIWNLRGILNTPRHRVSVQRASSIAKSNLQCTLE